MLEQEAGQLFEGARSGEAAAQALSALTESQLPRLQAAHEQALARLQADNDKMRSQLREAERALQLEQVRL